MHKLLIIDSDPSTSQFVAQALSGCAVDIVAYDDGAEALHALGRQPSDCVMLCVELQRGSGYSVCNKMRKDAELSRIPLILLSQQASEETFAQHRRLKTHADQYLKKPLVEADVLAALRPYLPIIGQQQAAAGPASTSTESTGLWAMADRAGPSRSGATHAVAAPGVAHPDGALEGMRPEEIFLGDLDLPDSVLMPTSVAGLADAPPEPAGPSGAVKPNDVPTRVVMPAALRALRDARGPVSQPPAPDVDAATLVLQPLDAEPTRTQVATVAPLRPRPPGEAPQAADQPEQGAQNDAHPAVAAAASTPAQRLDARMLRQRVAELEQALEAAEIAHAERLVAESRRSHEGLELKTRVAQLEREVAKAKETGHRLQRDAEAAAEQLALQRAESDASRGRLEALQAQHATLAEATRARQHAYDELAAQLAGLQAAHAALQNDKSVRRDAWQRACAALDDGLHLITAAAFG